MKKKIIFLLGLTTLSLFILSLSVAITINFRLLYYMDIDYLNITETVDLSKDQIILNYQVLLNYLNIPWINELNMPYFPSSASGLFHFFEVKKLFMLDYLIVIISGVGSFWFIKYLNRRQQSWKLLPYFLWGMFIPLTVLLALLVSFDTVFVLFHQVFFNNNAWLFNPATDPVILALPTEFFIHSFLLAFGLIQVFFISGYLFTKKRLQVSISAK